MASLCILGRGHVDPWALLLHLEPSIITSNLSRFFCLFLCLRFIEHGEYKGNYYGTSFDSVRSVLSKNKVCLLDVQPHVSNSSDTHSTSSFYLPLHHSILQSLLQIYFPPFHRCDIPHYSSWIFSEFSVVYVCTQFALILLVFRSAGDLMASLLIVPRLKISSGFVLV